ncbi:MAG: helix-turn-helix domain-containing protein [Ferruginibacter sp.]|nr:helix-turn-helix domain-containing protein [Ferruginibacter sp.]
MSKNYFQLTLVQKYQIEALKDADYTQRSIAKIIGVDRSTICRELKRNVHKRCTGAKIYSAEKAQIKTAARHKIKP